MEPLHLWSQETEPHKNCSEKGCLEEVIKRLRSHWKAKILLGVFLTAVFWAAYFALQRYPLFPVIQIPESPLDHSIPFQAGWVYLYASLSLYIPVAPLLLDSAKGLRSYCAGLLLMMFSGFLVFFFWPAACPHPPLPPGGDPLYAWIHGADGALNAFPSLHGAFAVYTALCFPAALGPMKGRTIAAVLIWGWCAGILFATMATKQHFFFDILAGAVLGGGAFLLFRSLRSYGDPIHDAHCRNGEGPFDAR